jgi:glycosyltransferase involved in cell wall biosynthesis
MNAWNVSQHDLLIIAPQVPPYGGVGLQAQLLVERVSQEGVGVQFLASNLPFPTGFGLFEDLRGLRPFLRSAFFCLQLWQMLEGIAVVHILACSWLYFFVVVCPAVIVSRLRGKRVVLNYHGGQADDFLRFWAFCLRPVFRMADVVTAPSGFLVEVITRRVGVPVRVVPNIVDLATFRYKRRASVQPRMVVSRHLEKLYDIPTVIRAFGEVQRQYPDASLSIAGSGSEEKHLRDIVSNWELRNVEFLGYVPHSRLSEVYDRCDILLNASRADNFPGSLLEAAAAGLVIVSTATGGIPYMFDNGKTALLVQVSDWQSMAAGICCLLEDAEFASSLTERARAHSEQYAWRIVWQTLRSCYGGIDTAGPEFTEVWSEPGSRI